MNLNQIINLITRIFVRKAVNSGINKGIDFAARRGKAAKDMTPAEHAQANSAREMAKKARKAARVTRRLGR